MGSAWRFQIAAASLGFVEHLRFIMLKKELATLLGVSESMVSRHAKKGMPTDSLERAQRWRKRHLEPGRIKGSRFDPKQSTGPVAPAAVTA